MRLAIALSLTLAGLLPGHAETPGGPPRAASPPSAARSEKAGLEDLIQLALESTPELKAARRSIDVMRSKISPAGALPDPELMFGQTNEGSLIPFTTLGDPDAGFSEIHVGFAQEFPFPGKLPLRRKVAELDARTEESRYKSTRLRIVSEVKAAFYELYAIQKGIEIVEKERNLLDQLAKIASVRYSVGKGIQQDVLDSEVEISKVEERLAILQRRKEAGEGLLNTPCTRSINRTSPATARFAACPLGKSARPLLTRVPYQTAATVFSLPVKHNHRLGGCQGELHVDEERVVYQTEHPEDARIWLYKDTRPWV